MIYKHRMVFFNVAHMKKYRGNPQADKPSHGGVFIPRNGWGGEIFNYEPLDKTMYGYVEPGAKYADGPQRRINITRLMRPGETRPTSNISGVLVAWVARPRVAHESVMVGWYEDAILHRESQPLPGRLLPNGDLASYFVTASEVHCVLLPILQRTLTIPRGKGAFGHSNICYMDSAAGDQVKDQVIDFIRRWKAVNRNGLQEPD